MKTKNSIVDLFDLRVEKVVAERAAEIRKRADLRIEGLPYDVKNKIFMELMEENKKYLPLWVVKKSIPLGYSTAYFIGQVEGEALFYQGDLYVRVSCLENGIPELEPLNIPSNILKVLKFLGSELLEKKSFSNQVVAPPGFYIFEYSSKFVTSASDGELTHSTQIIEADSIKQALDKLSNIFMLDSDNYFEDCQVFFENKWHEVKEDCHLDTHLSPDFKIDKVLHCLGQAVC